MIARYTRLGFYEVLAPLGAGGMGEVWRARDTRLGREVALKFLPDSVAGDAARLSRFEREAKLLASLSHPGVATLYGFETLEGTPFLVMEVVEGPTLAERLQRGALPWPEALEVGRNIAEALEAAHEHGIVHRDLKPSNVKVFPDGRVKLLDFGLGKAAEPKSAASEARFATETSPTDIGVILGTAPYMSPEQARGDPVDHRADIWAFCCVLYEMLTGKRAFAGPTASDVIAVILEREPDWSALPPATPPPVRSLLKRCLAKDPVRRLHSIADAGIELEEALTARALERQPPATASRWWLPIGAVTILAVFAGGAAAWLRTRTESAPRNAAMRLNVALARGTALSTFPGYPLIEISPDGRQLLYEAEGGGIYVRALDRVETRLVAGTERGSHPFFSPDGRWIGFVLGGKLQKVSVDGGAPRPIADASNMRGASWGDDGNIVYSPTPGAGLFSVSSEGGTPRRLTELEQPDGSHRWPQYLPGGTAVLFTKWPPNLRVQDARLVVLSLETGHQNTIVEGGTYGRYLPTGHLVYGSGGTVFAAPFDVRRLELTGPAVPVLENVRMAARSGSWMARNWSFTGIAQFAFSPTGVFGYVAPHYRPRETQLLWIDRTGSGVPLSSAPRAFANPSLSPDGRRLVVSVDEADGTTNLWLLDRDRRTWTQLTFEKSNEFPQWSPRGDRLAFASNREGSLNLFTMASEGGTATRVVTSDNVQLPTGWSPDGQTLLFRNQNRVTFWDVWEVPLDDERRPRPLVVAGGFQGGARLSPDGHWLAYVSTESGSAEVQVRPYRGADRRWTISTAGGSAPNWNRSGREMFYASERSGSYSVWGVPVSVSPTFRPGTPRALFERRGDQFGYDVSADGQHFVIAEDADAAPERLEIVVIPDWFEELKAKVPVTR
jgi:Tol biopolymer transport system component